MIELPANNSKPTADFFADTRDTLCYATNDNQTAVRNLLLQEADLAIVVGGYNSSNTSHLVELCEEVLPTFYISSEEEMTADGGIKHWNFHDKKEMFTSNFLPAKSELKVLISSGASCPDALVEGIIRALREKVPGCRSMENVENEQK